MFFFGWRHHLQGFCKRQSCHINASARSCRVATRFRWDIVFEPRGPGRRSYHTSFTTPGPPQSKVNLNQISKSWKKKLTICMDFCCWLRPALFNDLFWKECLAHWACSQVVYVWRIGPFTQIQLMAFSKGKCVERPRLFRFSTFLSLPHSLHQVLKGILVDSRGFHRFIGWGGEKTAGNF